MSNQPMRIQVVLIPVADVDRAKAFYADQVGFHVDHDVSPPNGMRVVQLTPPGSGCSIVLDGGRGRGGMTDMVPGTIKGIHLVVDDMAAVREGLLARGVAAGEIEDMGGILFSGFSDPDGNEWVLQQLPPRP